MMSTALLLAAVAAASGVLLTFMAALRARRSIVLWAFAVGTLLLAADCAIAMAIHRDPGGSTLRQWYIWHVVIAASLTGPWWVFSCGYARGEGTRLVQKSAPLLAFLALLPLGLWLARDTLFLAGSGTTPASLRLGTAGYLAYVVFLIHAVAVVMNLERTFRAAVGTTRWRIKFALLGVGIIFVTRIYTSSEVLLYRGPDPSLDLVNTGALLAAAPLILWSFIRSGHLEIDVYPSGPLLKNSVTVLVAGVYLFVVGVLAKLVVMLGDTDAFGMKAFIVLVAFVMLALGLQSDRLQWQLRHFVSRHFQRPLHDYRTVWKKFTEGTASKVEQADLCRTLAALVADVFGALSVRIWLLNEKADLLTLVATTSHNAGSAPAERPESIDAAAITSHFTRQPEPADFESGDAEWCEILRNGHPTDFPHGGHRVAVPLSVRGELLGVVTMGDRINGTPFTPEDLDLVQCIACHAAGSLLNVHLSQRLLQAKQLEAFQSMAAFFVHDLKNAASTLNLMFQNLPLHFDDPEFRADALRGIGKTVEHINRLIGRLSALRHELKVEPTDCDLNEVVTQALAGIGTLPHSTLVKEMQPVPRIPLDREQVTKVITNLVLNAAEAVPHEGRVRVATAQENGWVVLTVDDNGCGMSQDFISRSLFRPFQTTKKNGLGIGMFQSKMIVEAHGGRIAVSSTPGSGTKFQVYWRSRTTT